MKGERYPRSREERLLVETWLRVYQEWDAGWGIRPADLMDLLVTLIEAKDLREALKNSGGEEAALAASCSDVFQKIEKAARAIERQCLRADGSPVEAAFEAAGNREP
jgi:hypothetical protein